MSNNDRINPTRPINFTLLERNVLVAILKNIENMEDENEYSWTNNFQAGKVMIAFLIEKLEHQPKGAWKPGDATEKRK